MAAVAPNSDCSKLSGLGRTWGVRIRGTCVDISDVETDRACYLLKAAANPYAVALYKSDSCADNLIAYVDTYTDCQRLSQQTNDRVWGIRLNGQCRDISDMNFIQACEQFKNRRPAR